jgi:hypothetical protein
MAKKVKGALSEDVNEMIAMLNDEKQALKAENNVRQDLCRY